MRDDTVTAVRNIELPLASRPDEDLPGHWLLARLGKRVLRPGGLELTTRLLDHAAIGNAAVVELAPGLGRTASDIVARNPGSYRGVDSDSSAIENVRSIVGPHAEVTVADAADTGLTSASADVVLGEAILTMQGAKSKHAIVAEAVRLLRSGGRYAIHELGLAPDDLADDIKTEIRRSLARSIKVNARPQTIPEWCALLEGAGLVVEYTDTAPMALLQVRRLIADEGLGNTIRFVGRVLTRPAARRRVFAMWRTFRRYRHHLVAVAIIATRP